MIKLGYRNFGVRHGFLDTRRTTRLPIPFFAFLWKTRKVVMAVFWTFDDVTIVRFERSDTLKIPQTSRDFWTQTEDESIDGG